MKQADIVNNEPLVVYREAVHKTQPPWREGLLIISGLLTLAYIHYHVPEVISVFIQLLLLWLFYKSNKNDIWLFIMMFIIFQPGGLFSLSAKPFHLISGSGVGSITFPMGFILVAWLKAIKRKVPVFYLQSFVIFLVYMLILAPIFGAKSVSLIRQVIFYSWLIVLPQLLFNQEEYDRLFYLIFMANILVLGSNLLQIATARPLLGFFSPNYSLRVELELGELIRTSDAIEFAHLSIFGGLLYLSKYKSPIKPLMAYTGLVFGLLNIISSATRGWILSSLFMITGYAFFLLPKLFRNIVIIIPVLIVTVAIVWQVPIIRSQIIKAYDRTVYFENILNPDLNVETTDIGRVIRGARVMSKFRESPIIGFGMGSEAQEYLDGHTGNQSILLSFGIIGFILLINLWLGFVFRLISQARYLIMYKLEYKLNFLVVFAFISVFIIHSTSGGFLHPLLGSTSTVWYGLIFAYGNFLYYKGGIHP